FEDKVSIIISVSKDLQGRFQAGKLVKELTPIIGGKGGGRPDMAQGGGTQPEKLKELFKKFEEMLSQ
ncbi:MAG: DHHA1 domain-containing protein, partial [Pseudomonadota bacterium]